MKVRNLRHGVIAFGISSAAVSVSVPVAASENFTLVPSIAFQSKELTFDQTYSGLENNVAKFSVSMPLYNLSVTGVYKKFYATLKYEKSMSATPTSTSETDRSLLGQSNLIALDGSEVNVDRADMSFTLGYNVWKKLNVFVGYLDGETKLEPYPFCAEFGSCVSINRAFQQFAIGAAENASGDTLYPDHPSYRQAYTESGLYFGSSYGFTVADAGVLSLSFAYAQMDGRYSDNAEDPGFVDANVGFRHFYPPANGDITATSFVAFDYSGDTTGTSLGLTWTGSLGDSHAYFVDVRRQAYSMTGQDQTGTLSDISLKTKETMMGITVGIQAYLF